jgi:hypothetical protein
MNIITTRGIIGLLVNQVRVARAEDFAEQCVQVGMTEHISPERDEALSLCNSVLPPFDAQHHFVFKLDGKHEAVFEILGKDGVILQAGYQALFPSLFPFRSKANGKYNDAVQALEGHYGTGMPINQSGSKTMNFGNATTVGYAAIMKTGRAYSLTSRVGNRHFWN